MNAPKNKQQTQEITILENAERVSNGSTHDTPIIASPFKEAYIFLEVESASGSEDRSLLITLQMKNPITGTWFDVQTFPVKSSAGFEFLKVVNLGSVFALKYDINGTTSPKFKFGVYAVFKK